MAWLLRDGDVLAAIEQPIRGWRASLQGAVILPRAPLVLPGLGRSARALDLARCKRDGSGHTVFQVARIRAVGPGRLAVGPPAGVLLVAPSGSFERWNLRVGDRLEVQ